MAEVLTHEYGLHCGKAYTAVVYVSFSGSLLVSCLSVHSRWPPCLSHHMCKLVTSHVHTRGQSKHRVSVGRSNKTALSSYRLSVGGASTSNIPAAHKAHVPGATYTKQQLQEAALQAKVEKTHF